LGVLWWACVGVVGVGFFFSGGGGEFQNGNVHFSGGVFLCNIQ